jgi:hypothetical protein
MGRVADARTTPRGSGAFMELDELLALPVSMDLVTAGRALGIGRTKAHELVRAGAFPVRVLRIGHAYRVTRADLLHVLGETHREDDQFDVPGETDREDDQSDVPGESDREDDQPRAAHRVSGTRSRARRKARADQDGARSA